MRLQRQQRQGCEAQHGVSGHFLNPLPPWPASGLSLLHRGRPRVCEGEGGRPSTALGAAQDAQGAPGRSSLPPGPDRLRCPPARTSESSGKWWRHHAPFSKTREILQANEELGGCDGETPFTGNARYKLLGSKTNENPPALQCRKPRRRAGRRRPPRQGPAPATAPPGREPASGTEAAPGRPPARLVIASPTPSRDCVSDRRGSVAGLRP